MVLIRLLLTLLLLAIFSLSAGASELSVFAASSLTEPLRELARNYESDHAGTKILLNFSGSQTLASQIEQGAPADLFISANQPVMERLEKQGLVGTPQPLLRNQLALAVRRGLHPAITGIRDLARPGLLLTIGNREVPVGSYFRQLLSALPADPDCGPDLVARIEGNVVSEENQVKAILTKLMLGETDAGIVYRSDLASPAAEGLTNIPLPTRHLPRISYPLAKVQGGNRQTGAFVNYLLSKSAARIFARYGLQLENGR